MMDEDYLANPEPEAPGKWFGRQVGGAAHGAINPMGISAWVLKALAARGIGMTPENADLFSRVSAEQKRAAPAAARFGTGLTAGAIGGPAAIGGLSLRAGMGFPPISYMLRQGISAAPLGAGAGLQISNILEDEPRDEWAQGRYRPGGY